MKIGSLRIRVDRSECQGDRLDLEHSEGDSDGAYSGGSSSHGRVANASGRDEPGWNDFEG